MKRVFIWLFCLLLIQIAGNAQNKSKAAKPAQGIRQYWFVLLLKGPSRQQDSATAATLQDGHMANIRRLYNQGKLKVAGPFGDDGNYRGIFIFDCPSRQEVQQLLDTDPAIAAGRLAYEILPWYTAPIGSFKPGKPIPAE
ncbi:MAG: hypothetical protein RL172_2459 [Bacteroidota bacterium]|jgi:uncharacterized protein